jgi:hypothetical protein
MDAGRCRCARQEAVFRLSRLTKRLRLPDHHGSCTRRQPYCQCMPNCSENVVFCIISSTSRCSIWFSLPLSRFFGDILHGCIVATSSSQVAYCLSASAVPSLASYGLLLFRETQMLPMASSASTASSRVSYGLLLFRETQILPIASSASAA